MTHGMGMNADQIMAGAEVFGSDNEKIGTVADVGSNYFLVQKGFLFIKDLYLPTRTIARMDGERIYLNVPKHEAEQMAAEQLPAEGDAWYGTGTAMGKGTGMGTGTGYTTDTANTTTRTTEYTTPVVNTTTTDRTMNTGMTGRTTDTTMNTGATMNTGRTTDRVAREGENISVPVVEEELRAGVREVEGGRARIVKDVVSEQQSIDVPVQREEVYVTERAVDRPATQADLDAMDRNIEIPLREQEVVTSKQAVVTGEVSIRKETVTDTQRVTDTVRREEVHVEGGNTDRIHTEGNLTADQRTRFATMNETDRTRYGRFTEAERREYDALTPERQTAYATEYDRRNPLQKAADKITGNTGPTHR